MSKIISIRLDDKDLEHKPDEAKAVDILTRWEAAGRDRRWIITRALLALENITPSEGIVDLMGELRRALSETQRLAESLRRNPVAFPDAAPVQELSELRPELRAAIKKSARPGFKVK